MTTAATTYDDKTILGIGRPARLWKQRPVLPL